MADYIFVFSLGFLLEELMKKENSISNEQIQSF